MKLYEINKEIETLIEKGFSVDEETGEVKYTSEDLEQLEIDRSDKIENTCLFVKNKKMLIDAIKAEEKALAERRKRAEKEIERLEDYLTFCVNAQKFETPKCSITFKKSIQTVVDDDTNLPEEYQTVKTTVTANKTAIKKALQNGVHIDGCHLDEHTNITIK